jgi:hypothetical protein
MRRGDIRRGMDTSACGGFAGPVVAAEQHLGACIRKPAAYSEDPLSVFGCGLSAFY